MSHLHMKTKIASDKCSKYLQELFRSIGFKIQIIPQESNGDHFIAELGEGKKGVLCVSHYDTVFPIGTIKYAFFKIEKTKHTDRNPGHEGRHYHGILCS